MGKNKHSKISKKELKRIKREKELKELDKEIEELDNEIEDMEAESKKDEGLTFEDFKRQLEEEEVERKYGKKGNSEDGLTLDEYKKQLEEEKLKDKYDADDYDIKKAKEDLKDSKVDDYEDYKEDKVNDEDEDLYPKKENADEDDIDEALAMANNKKKKSKKAKEVEAEKEDSDSDADEDLDKAEKKKNRKEAKMAKKAEKRKKIKHPMLRIFGRVILVAIILGIVAVVAAVVAIISIFKTDKWNITREQLLSNAGATIYDKDGNQIIELTGDEINKRITFEEMGNVPKAFIAIEDERFYEHKGVDFKRTASAIVGYVLKRGNGATHGGSTITQQLVKITMNDDERTGKAGIERKIREWSRATQVEKMLEKNEIIERYLNRIYLGTNNGLEVRGVEAASNYYFNKTAKDLDWAQAAFIAGINHSPGLYAPFDESDAAKNKVKSRTKTVLKKLKELKYITEEEYNAAVTEVDNGLPFEKGSMSNGKNEISYHTAAAIDQIAKELKTQKDISYEQAREMVIGSGYKIYTTVDQTVQAQMEEQFKLEKFQREGSGGSGDVDRSGQSAMVIIDHQTGYIVGEVGGLGEGQSTLGLNRAISARQGGSSFKPLATVYPGLATGTITAATLFNDQYTSFGSYNVKNDSSYHGICDMRTILTYSLNVPEVKLLSIMGVNVATEHLDKIGIHADPDNVGLSLALGPVDVTPVQMAAGYAMIANGGEYITPTFYTKVLDQNGETVIEAKQERNRVMSEQDAYIEKQLLQGPYRSGTAATYSGYLGAMDCGCKTGTSDSYIDRWLCGFTPYYAAACWYGNDNGYENHIRFNSTNPAMVVWFNVMKQVQEAKEEEMPYKSFDRPDGIVTRTICRASGKCAGDKCTDTYSEIFASDHIPDSCDAHNGESCDICLDTEKRANQYCPNKETRFYGYIIDTERNANWSPKMNANPPEETCDEHKAPEEIDVPDVVAAKLNEAEAKKKIEAAGFKVKVVYDDKSTSAKGTVIAQSKKKAPKGSEITITVSSGKGSGGGTDPKPDTNTTTNTTENTTTNTTENKTTNTNP